MNTAPERATVSELRAEFWTKRARHYLEEALDAEGDDAIIAASAAVECFHIAWGEHPVEPALNGHEELRPCICPPDLLERGGFKGGCPRHAS